MPVCVVLVIIFQEPKPESEVEIVTPLLEEVHEEVVPEVQQVVQYVTSHCAACLHAVCTRLLVPASC